VKQANKDLVRSRAPLETILRVEMIRNTTLSSLQRTKKVTGRGDPQGCETSRIPHFLDSQLPDSGEVVKLRRKPSFTPR
jgi:hypothetical protein